MASLFTFAVVAAVLAVLWVRYMDLFIVCLPQYLDGYFVRALYSRDKINTGTSSIPLISRVHPSFLVNGDLKSIINPDGYPTHVKNVMDVDHDAVLEIMSRGNKGKNMRMLDYNHNKLPHISPSCAYWKNFKNVSFDDFAYQHMFSNVSENHSYLYAGFEAITEPETLYEMTGIDLTLLGDYKQNNLFASNFPKEMLSATMHCAPIDSVALQLIGTKTWYFMSPENMAEIPNIPMPTAFNLPMTDDELLSKIKYLHIVKQAPGDLVYFGPNWCHAVSTTAGPNLMMNMRYKAPTKVKKLPFVSFLKLLIRQATRTIGGLPQDNLKHYPIIYDDLNGYFKDCGISEAFMKIFETVKAMTP